ncbi:MAG: ABC-F family ATP-binding cassette domain-containing protein [Rhodobacteraceae bacterium]|nr:ABC-F family ATP-binding cassette domain-containing protein [Paracoccaceae bacterium]
MAINSLLQLNDIALTYGGDPLFVNLDMLIKTGDRAALIGRNGSGKSTLMKVLAGLVSVDSGSRVLSKGISVGYLEQDPDFTNFASLGDFAISNLNPKDYYKSERIAESIKLSLDKECSSSSGGERRRAAIVKLFAEEPDLLLLDEPTNHLDIDGILWLEQKLARTNFAYLVISHDRAFLKKLTKQTFWIDRAIVRRRELGFLKFEDWRDKTWLDEDNEWHKLDRKIKAETRWSIEGISGRRKRNMGRMRALDVLRDKKLGNIKRQGIANVEIDSSVTSGHKVIDAREISKFYDNKPIIQKFSIKIVRGERVAIVGRNGVGKSTLINLLIGKLKPDSGKVVLGTDLHQTIFDQNRDVLNQDLSLWENLTTDPDLGISGSSDTIMVRGNPRHVVGYLKDFLFLETQARMPVRSLSGGEKARLVLAKILSKTSNLLILDEPTNDFDLETLDLLQEVLADYSGTVLLVSHDRDFINRIATKTLVMNGSGGVEHYNGGWSDYFFKENDVKNVERTVLIKKQKQKQDLFKKTKKNNLSFTQAHRLKELPDEIVKLNKKIEEVEHVLSDVNLYSDNAIKFLKFTEALDILQKRLTSFEEEWLYLEEISEKQE